MTKLIRLRNAIRVMGLGSIMLVALSFGAGLAKANVSITGGNSTTGFNSVNLNNWDINHSISVDVSNASSTLNDQTFAVDTGDTTVDNNTKVGDLTTGNVSGSIHVVNHLNPGDIHLMNTDPGSILFDLGNVTTGFNSLNDNTLSLDITRSVNISNLSSIDNNLAMSANSGNNTFDNNTVVGNIRTGSLSLNASETNTANGGLGSVNLGNLGGFTVSGHTSNVLTGAQSTNNNNVDVNANTDVNIVNEASINNTTALSGNTGGNTIDNNTVVGNVSTGNVSFVVSTTNSAN